jgi:hypothetical protein
MSNPLTPAGGQPQKETKFAPLWSNEFWTGLWTQRSPLRDAATPFLYGKFYGATRYESLIDGLNVEISPRLTLTRRPGNSVYNSQNFTNVTRFYDFRINNGTSENIRTIVDTTTAVYDGTGPSTKTLLYTKQAGAGKCSLLGVGNTLYMGDGVQQQKWVKSPVSWTANGVWTVGQFIVDTNNNLQKALGLSATITNIVISTVGVLTVTCSNTFAVGDVIQFYGLTKATFLNGQAVTILTASGSQFTATFTYNTGTGYPTATDTGLATCPAKTGTAGSVQPTWTTITNGLTLDGTNGWLCRGNSVMNWGLIAPAVAPTAINTLNTTYPQWQANTFYSPGLLIVDSNSNIQLLTTSGTAGSTQPTWNVTAGGTTTDGTAVWTNQGTATRSQNHAYATGACISVAYTVVVFIPAPRNTSASSGRFRLPVDLGSGGDVGGGFTYSVNYTDTFKCTTAGTSANATTATVGWKSGVGTQVSDGTVVWTNQGTSVTWLTANGGGSLASTALSLVNQIADSHGNLQTVVTGGKSGSSAPAWATTSGQNTTDNNVTWVNGGPVTAPNTSPWLYSVAFMNSITGDISTASPLSSPILLAANSYITISGQSCPDPQADMLRIYRTTQGQTTPFALADIFLPTDGGSWTYADAQTDLGLNQLEEAPVDEANDPPPAGAVHQVFHLNRIFVAVGNTVFYSGGPDTLQGNGNDTFPPNNFFSYPSTVQRMWASAYGLLVLTTSDIYVISGSGTTSSALNSYPFEQGIGILSEDCFTVNGSTAYLITADRTISCLDPASGVTEPGFPIGDQIKTFDPAASYLAWLVSGDDKGLFVANGSTGWFRLNPTPAPETGYSWSPFAQIASGSGCGAVACIETTPGTRKLLIGPVGTGPILQRDTTTNQDNGVSYSAFATAGSIVVAVPSQTTMLEFIAADCTKVGSNVATSVLLNEISGTFTSLSIVGNDPPGFAAPSTLYSSRWYLDQTQAPRECRHLQIKFSWPAENAANELLSFSLFGGYKQQQ